MKMKIGPWKKRAAKTKRPPKAAEAVKETHGFVAEKNDVKEAKVASSEAETMIMKASSDAAKGETAGKVETLGDMEIAAKVEVKEEEEAVPVHNDKSAMIMSAKEEAAGTAKKDVLVHNSMSEMIMQASEVAKGEAAGMEAETMLGDMEITLNSIKPKPTPLPVSPLKNAPPPLSTRSPTSQFEYDIMNATHQNLDYISLQKQKSYSLNLMDEEESISSEESLQEENKADEEIKGQSENENKVDDELIVEIENVYKTEDVGCSKCVDDIVTEDFGLSDFVDDVLHPMSAVADFMFCKMECAFPEAVEDANEYLSSNLHHLVFQGDEKEGEAQSDAEEDDAGDDEDAQGEEEEVEDKHGEDEEEDQEDGGVEAVLGCPEEQGEGGVDEQQEDEVVSVDGRKDSEDDAEVGLSHWQWESMQARIEQASYSPKAGFVLIEDGWLPGLQFREDDVLIQVDTTTISTRDCLERLRRDNNKKLKEELWVPGHEIVGHVVRTGTDSNAMLLLGKRIAALLPNGGGCSQYACINAKDAIVLPDDACSETIVALLSAYMTAYQCLESVVGIEPKEEGDDVSEEGEDVDVESEEEDDIESEEEDDIESKGEENVKPKKQEHIVFFSAQNEDVEGEKDAEPKKEGDAEPKEEEDVKPTEVENVEPNNEAGEQKNEEDIEPEKMEEEDEPKGGEVEDVQQKNEENIDEVEEPKKEDDEDVEPEVEEKNEAKVEKKEDVKPKTTPLIVDDAGEKKSPLFGKSVLIVGAGSPVGVALVDLARHAGANVYTLSHSSHLGVIREMGANHWYPLANQDVWKEQWRGKIDLVVDTIGDPDYNPSFYKVMKTVRGRFVKVNFTSCGEKYVPPTTLRKQRLRLLKGYKERVINDKTVDYNIFNSYKEDMDLFEEDLSHLHDLLQEGKIGPKISSRVGFDELEGEWKKIMGMGGAHSGGVVVVSP